MIFYDFDSWLSANEGVFGGPFIRASDVSTWIRNRMDDQRDDYLEILISLLDELALYGDSDTEETTNK